MTTLRKSRPHKRFSDFLIWRLVLSKSICSVTFGWSVTQIDKTISVKWIPTIFSGVRPPLPPVKSPNIVSKRSSQIKSGETYFGRSLVFPGQIGSLFRLRCQPSSVKRKVKGPLLTSICEIWSACVKFGSKWSFCRQMVPQWLFVPLKIPVYLCSYEKI